MNASSALLVDAKMAAAEKNVVVRRRGGD